MQTLSVNRISDTDSGKLTDLEISDFPIYYIETDSQLSSLADYLSEVDWIAIDTEFIREKTYYPQLCLIQIATDNFAACIDPLKLANIDRILNVIFNENITKVLHAGRQDMEIFYYLKGTTLKNVFDTQLAAPYIGLAEQISYAAMVAHFTGLKINKSQTRTDWRARPLTADQIKYAASDVYYLAKVYTVLLNQLLNRNRLPWVEEEFVKFTSTDNYAQDPNSMWQKIRGHDRLSEKGLSVLVSLAAWREKTARKMDCPRNWLIRDDILVELARFSPSNQYGLKKISNLNDKLRVKYGEAILECIKIAEAHAPQIQVKQKIINKLSSEQVAVVDVLMALVRRCSLDHNINSSVIASKKDLEQFLVDRDSSKLMKGWRKSIIGDQLADTLRGEIAIKIIDNQLVLTDRNKSI